MISAVETWHCLSSQQSLALRKGLEKIVAQAEHRGYGILHFGLLLLSWRSQQETTNHPHRWQLG